MLWVFGILWITQLAHSEVPLCHPHEYEVPVDCCRRCFGGNTVARRCALKVTTTCIPCMRDKYTEHPNGLTECQRCELCDTGARLPTNEKCTYTKETLCGCAPGHFCSYTTDWNTTDWNCEMCTRSTVCPPGSRLKVPGTEFSDNQCEVCPDGTFSASNMSRACQPWTKCEEQRMTEAKAGTRISDAVCQQSSLSGAVIAVIIILLVLLAASGAGGYFLWPKVKRKYNVTCKQGTEDEQKQAEPLKDNRAGTLPVQETVTENAKSSPGSI
ncbi:tumor necrosis factor receptor superfamily member 14-like isoform X3 [Pelodiscus sinensis]|uniref:tumor necrosis factor receptor superfamily member 14-like isoform X3 n=1 Tax=Pelodiscus sinensis TaxID=13735 RepID=UPI003F6A5E33